MTKPDEFRVASSLDTAKRGEVVVHDRKGAVMSGGKYRAHVAVATAAGVGLSAGLGAIGWLLIAPPVGVVVGGAMAAYLVFARKRGLTAERALARREAGDLDGAQQEFEQLRATLSRADRWAIDFYIANILWLKGESTAALELLVQAEPRARGALRFSLLFQLAWVQAMEGKLDAARATLAETDDAPESPVFSIHRAMAELLIAFHADSVDGLADEDALHEVGTLVLRTNRYGSVLVLLAWACDRRGDADLAEHWLGESESRMLHDLERCMPKLAAWRDAQPQR